MRKWLARVSLLFVLAGCQRGAYFEQRQPTANDTPFGGGFPPSQHPDGDRFQDYQRRNEIRLVVPNGAGQALTSERPSTAAR